MQICALKFDADMQIDTLSIHCLYSPLCTFIAEEGVRDLSIAAIVDIIGQLPLNQDLTNFLTLSNGYWNLRLNEDWVIVVDVINNHIQLRPREI